MAGSALVRRTSQYCMHVTVPCRSAPPGQLLPELTYALVAEPCKGQCVAEYDKCGGKGYTSPKACCNPDYSCVKKNDYYAQCVSDARAATNIATGGWDGEVLECSGGGSYGEGTLGAVYGDTAGAAGEEETAGSYGGCGGQCVAQFAKCAGIRFGGRVASCCNPEHSCVKKNEYYAQVCFLDHQHQGSAVQACSCSSALASFCHRITNTRVQP